MEETSDKRARTAMHEMRQSSCTMSQPPKRVTNVRHAGCNLKQRPHPIAGRVLECAQEVKKGEGVWLSCQGKLGKVWYNRWLWSDLCEGVVVGHGSHLEQSIAFEPVCLCFSTSLHK